MNVERLVKRFRIATDRKARDRILSDALEVLAEVTRPQEIPAMITNGGMVQPHGFFQGMDVVRLFKLLILGTLIAVGYVGAQYLVYVVSLQQYMFR